MFLTQSLRDNAAPLQYAAWRRFAEWAGLPFVEVSRPYLYGGRGGCRALAEHAEGVALSGAIRIALEPPREFALLPEVMNALSFSWPYDVCPELSTGNAPALLAGARHTLAVTRQAGLKAGLIPPPLAIEESLPPAQIGDLGETVVWWAANGASELAPGRMADFLAARRGPLFCARLCPHADPRAMRSLLAAADMLTTGRLLLLVADDPRPFNLLRELFDLDGYGVAARDRLGIALDSSDAAVGGFIASSAQFVVAATSSTALRAAEDHLWMALAIRAGCAPIGPAGGGLEDLLPEHSVCRPPPERPKAWELEAAFRGEAPSDDALLIELTAPDCPAPRGWSLPPPVLGTALAAAEVLGETEHTALAWEALARVRADRGFPAIQDGLSSLLADSMSEGWA